MVTLAGIYYSEGYRNVFILINPYETLNLRPAGLLTGIIRIDTMKASAMSHLTMFITAGENLSTKNVQNRRQKQYLKEKNITLELKQQEPKPSLNLNDFCLTLAEDIQFCIGSIYLLVNISGSVLTIN
jgi:hypothetical protein